MRGALLDERERMAFGKMKNSGFIQIYTGNGKGKTTAAIGLAVRAAGAGLKVCFIQFVKGQPSGEFDALSRLENVTVHRFGCPDFIKNVPAPGDKTECNRGYAEALKAVEGGLFDLVILDEFCVTLELGLLSTDDAGKILDLKRPHIELVITGRNAPQYLIDRADLVTEMRDVKHYFKDGVKARKGIEY
jgi:cob(I)alamin adenosyltransferase